MLMWIFFWWLLGAIVLGYLVAFDRGHIVPEQITVGDVLGSIAFPLIWPAVALLFVCEDLMSLPVFDLDWFRKGKRDE